MERARWAVAVLLLGIMAGFLAITSRQNISSNSPPSPPAPATPPSTSNGPVAAPPTPGEANSPAPGALSPKPGPSEIPAIPASFTESTQCQSCHKAIYEEWKSDEHSTAWNEDIFRMFTKNYEQVECLSCHAPEPMLDTGILTNVPKLRETHREEGVDCLTCHLKGGKSCGTLGSKASCGGQQELQLKGSQACYHCHSTHNLFKEYLASDQRKQGISCQDCHMEKVTRPVAEGSPPRETRRHLFHSGGHDPEGLKKALKVDMAVDQGDLLVTVTNVGAAHGVPGEINNRIVRMELSVLVNKGVRMVDGKPSEVIEEALAREAIFRPPPRMMRDKIPSTQIMPGEPRVLRYKLLDSDGLPVKHGQATVTLSFKLQPSMLNSEATHMCSTEFKF